MTKTEFLQLKVSEICHLLKLSDSRENAISNGDNYFLATDYYSACGGYKLMYIGTESGGRTAFGTDYRVGYKEYITYLDGIIDGLRRLNTPCNLFD